MFKSMTPTFSTSMWINFSCLDRINAQKLNSCRAYSPRSAFYKATDFYDTFNMEGSIIAMTDPHQHKIRRNMLNPLFSARSIDSISSRTTLLVQRALEIAITHAETGKAINIQQLFRRIAVSFPWGFILLDAF